MVLDAGGVWWSVSVDTGECMWEGWGVNVDLAYDVDWAVGLFRVLPPALAPS